MFMCIFDRFLNRNVHAKLVTVTHASEGRPPNIHTIDKSTVKRSNRLLTHPKCTYSRQIHNLGSTGQDSVGFCNMSEAHAKSK